MAEQAYLIPASMRDSLIAYLSDRPFKEVNGGLQALQNLPAFTPPADAGGTRVRYMRESPTDYQLAHAQGSKLMEQGDMVLVWAHQGDLLAAGTDQSPGA